jgi:hypothetical protein
MLLGRAADRGTEGSPMLSAHTYSQILMVCAAVLAYWTTVRFPNVRPQTLAAASAHVVLAYLAILTVAGSLSDYLYALPVSGSFELAVIAGALVPTVYFFLSLCWIVRSLQTLTLSRR